MAPCARLDRDPDHASRGMALEAPRDRTVRRGRALDVGRCGHRAAEGRERPTDGAHGLRCVILKVPRKVSLPLGIFTPSTDWTRCGIKRQTLHDPIRGDWAGPFYVIREATREEYAEWFVENTGTLLTREEWHALAPCRCHFYEISLD